MTRLLAAQLAHLFAREAGKLERRARVDPQARVIELHLARASSAWAGLARVPAAPAKRDPEVLFPLTRRDLPR